MTAGITGGLGCGKSTAARMLEKRGLRRIDSDLIVRDEVLADPAVIAQLRARYGDEVIERAPDQPRGPEGAAGGPARLVVNRPALARRVFSSDMELLWLEELTHPRVFAAWRRAFAAEPHVHWVVEVPLLFEKALENWFDFTVCVACAPAKQLARLEQRGLSRELAGQRISKQLPLTRKIELSDFVLWNEGSPEFLEAQIDRLADALVAP